MDAYRDMAGEPPQRGIARSGTHADPLMSSHGTPFDDYLEPLPSLVKTSSAIELNKQSQVMSSPFYQDSRATRSQQQISAPGLVASPSEISTPLSPAPETRSIWKTVFDETVYFAGGLISHPFESTKHYSILRHSAPLVMYRGPSTSVTISVFGDEALPSDRSFWLQRKGFSGNMGMAASALMGTTSNWIDVTPSVESSAMSVPESDERAWQRDIKKFLKGAANDRHLSKHVIRETCVLRIPATATDGYLRVVMCTGQSSKKSLCPSPTFRLASASSDASIIRGASVATLPLEVGLKAVSVIGNQYFQRVVGPAQAVVQSGVKRLEPGFVKKNTAMLALAGSNVNEKYGHLEKNFDATQHVSYSPFHEQGTLDEPPPIIGSDSGPEDPFPLSFTGKVIPGTGLSWAQYNIPTANLANVPEESLLRLNGIYIGWAAVEPDKNPNGFTCNWHEAIITIGPSPYAPSKVAAQRVATVHIINDFGEAVTFFHAKLQVMVMAFLRPNPNNIMPPADFVAAFSRDIVVAVASLSRDRWQHDAITQAVGVCEKEKTLADRYVGFRSQIQRHVDNLPVHWAGVRTDRAELKDEAYGRGGFYIRR